MGLTQTQYVSPADRLGIPQSTFTAVTLEGRFERQGLVRSYVEFGASLGVSCLRQCSYLEVPQAYVEQSPAESNLSFRVGRVLREENSLDSFWELGITEGRHRWNYLHPMHVGLAGFFASYRATSMLEVNAFASPLSVPERGIPIDADRGQLDSPTPWFLHPPTSIDFAGQTTPVKYHLAVPPLSDLLFKPGAGAEIKLRPYGESFAKLAYYYKPMNQLAIGVDPQFDLSQLAVTVDLHPRVVYHHLINFESGWGNEERRAWVGLTREVPVDKESDHEGNQETADRWVRQQFRPATVFNAGVRGGMGLKWRGEELAYRAGYLQVWGGNAPDQSPWTAGPLSQFEDRYPFARAALVGLDVPVLTGFHRLGISSTYLADVQNQGSLISLSVIYQRGQRWRAEAGADVLAGNPERSNNYMAQYRANDRVYGSLRYAF